MSVRIRVPTGTRPTNQPPLCLNCRNAQVIKATRESDDQIYCQNLPYPANHIRIHVVECGWHVPRNGMYLNEMERRAWIIELEPEKDYNLPTGKALRVKWSKPTDRDEPANQPPTSTK